jgi:hypothetical protein
MMSPSASGLISWPIGYSRKVAARVGPVDRDHRILGAVDHEGGQRLVGGLRLDLIGERVGKPARHGEQTGVAGRIVEPNEIGHQAALAEARQHQLALVDGITLAGVVDEDLEQALRHRHGGRLGRPARAHRKPGVAGRHLGPDFDGRRPLRAQHDGAPPVEDRRESDQVVSAGAKAVQGDDRRKGSFATGNVCRVEEFHGGAG